MSDEVCNAKSIRGVSLYALFCYVISIGFAVAAGLLFKAHNPVFVWAVVGYLTAFMFGRTDYRSSWQPLRDISNN